VSKKSKREPKPVRGGIGFTTRGDRIEATYNIPASELPEGVKRKRITAHGLTAQEAQKKLLAKLAKQKISSPIKTSDDGITLSEWIDEYIEDYVRYRVQESTLKVYTGQIDNYIKPYVGHLPLETISIRDLKLLWWDKIQKLKKRDAEGNDTDDLVLNSFALNNVYKTLKMIMDAAEAKYNVKVNVSTDFFAVPTTHRPESDRQVSREAEKLEKFFFEEMDRDDPLWSHFMFALLGLRQSERLGLQMKSVVLDDGEPRLEIYQQLDFSTSKGGWYLKDTTKNGQPREVPLWDEFLEAAEKRIALREKWSKQPDWNPDPKFADLLFLGEGGKLITRRKDTPLWHSLGLEMRGHLARHITGHILAKRDISPETAKIILGHESDAYMHYYRVISNEMASEELRRKFRRGPIKRT
jgi:integrase